MMIMNDLPIHRTCVRVNSADDDDGEESRDEVDHDLPKKNPFIRVSFLKFLYFSVEKKSISNVFTTSYIHI